MSDAVTLPVWLTVGETTCAAGAVTARPHPDDWQPKLAEFLRELADEFDQPPAILTHQATSWPA